MHWLEKFRSRCIRRDGKRGISRQEFAAMVKLENGVCSEKLIEIIEEGGATCPNIAKAIADLTHATHQQHASMLSEARRAGFEAPKPRRRSECKKKPQPLTPDIIPDTARRVVKLNRDGKITAIFESSKAAAEQAGVAYCTVYSRCARIIGSTVDEFKKCGCTWRFEEEWKTMSRDVQLLDMEAAAHRAKRKSKRRENECKDA